MAFGKRPTAGAAVLALLLVAALAGGEAPPPPAATGAGGLAEAPTMMPLVVAAGAGRGGGSAGPSTSSAPSPSSDAAVDALLFSLGDMFPDLPKNVRDLPRVLGAKVFECVKKTVAKCVLVPTRACLKDALAECGVKI